MTIKEVKEQLQEDLICIVDRYDRGIVTDEEFDELKTLLCQAVIDNLNKLNQ